MVWHSTCNNCNLKNNRLFIVLWTNWSTVWKHRVGFCSQVPWCQSGVSPLESMRQILLPLMPAWDHKQTSWACSGVAQKRVQPIIFILGLLNRIIRLQKCPIVLGHKSDDVSDTENTAVPWTPVPLRALCGQPLSYPLFSLPLSLLSPWGSLLPTIAIQSPGQIITILITFYSVFTWVTLSPKSMGVFPD